MSDGSLTDQLPSQRASGLKSAAAMEEPTHLNEEITDDAQPTKPGVAARLIQLLRSRAVRIGFLVVALLGAAWAIVSQWDSISSALVQLPWYVVVIGVVIAIVYVYITMLSWREVLVDLGSHLSVADAGRLFFISQLGKYVPGGVWNYLAVVEMGADHEIPRRRSLSAMVVSVLISIVTAGLLALPGIAFTGVFNPEQRVWFLVLIPVVACLLVPRVLNSLISVALRIAKRPQLEQPLTIRGVLRSSAWALVGWLLAGTLVWLLSIHLGMPATFESFLLAAGGYSLSWALGFIVFFMPAGLGVREVVLAVMLAGQLEPGALIVVVLMARVLSTLGDIALGLWQLAVSRKK